MRAGSSPGVCVLASGGLDSSILMAELLSQGREVHPLYVRGGLLWERAELFWLRRLLKALKAPGLRPLALSSAPMAELLGRHWSLSGRGVPAASSPWDSVYLPGRNLLLLSHAGVFCAQRGIPRIALAVLKGNPFADARPAFLRSMGEAMTLGLGRPLHVEAPYLGVDKARLLGRVRGFPWHLTFSCLRPRGVTPCGRCSKCEERRGAPIPGCPRS